MHISEGILSAPVLITGAVIAGTGVAYGLKTIKPAEIPKVGVMSAVFFVASLIHLPIGPASMHLVLNGMMGILLGWAAFPAICVGLLFQALLFGFGGLTTLGINTCIMAIPAVVVFYLFRFLRGEKNGTATLILAFLSGFVAIFISASLLVAALVTTEESFVELAKIAFAAHLPVMVVEGIVTLFAISFLYKVKPDLVAGVVAS